MAELEKLVCFIHCFTGAAYAQLITWKRDSVLTFRAIVIVIHRRIKALKSSEDEKELQENPNFTGTHK